MEVLAEGNDGVGGDTWVSWFSVAGGGSGCLESTGMKPNSTIGAEGGTLGRVAKRVRSLLVWAVIAANCCALAWCC